MESGPRMIKPEDIIVKVEDYINAPGYPKGTICKMVTAIVVVAERITLDRCVADNVDAIAATEEVVRSMVWDRIYEPGVFRDRVHEAIESGEQEGYGSGCLSRAGEETYRQGLISLLSYLDMPRPIRMDNGSTIAVTPGNDTLRGGRNLADDPLT